MENIDEYRKKIDQIDDAILSLLKKRFDIVKKIGEHKKARHILMHDKKREEHILTNIKQKAEQKSIDLDLINTIWQAIFKKSIELEQ